MILKFGKYKGIEIKDLTDEAYLKWLAKPEYGSKFYKSLHSTELTWKVPFDVKLAARGELMRRGFELIGERWEK